MVTFQVLIFCLNFNKSIIYLSRFNNWWRHIFFSNFWICYFSGTCFGITMIEWSTTTKNAGSLYTLQHHPAEIRQSNYCFFIWSYFNTKYKKTQSLPLSLRKSRNHYRTDLVILIDVHQTIYAISYFWIFLTQLCLLQEK